MDLDAALLALDGPSDEETLEDLILLDMEARANRKSHPRNFRLSDLSEERCKELFRFEKEDIPRLASSLNLPLLVETPNRLKIHQVEALCILLRRLAYPCRLSDVAAVFGRHPADISTIFTTTLNLLYDAHHQRLQTLDHPWLDVAVLSERVATKGSPLPRCFGFIDGTVRPIARPSENQRECYNGHKRVHALKFQAVTLPNGIIGHLFGPMSGRRHDSALLAESGLMAELLRVAPDHYIYGDQAYPLRRQLLAPYRGARLTEQQENFNREMGRLRMCVEWSFGKILQYFAFLDYKKNQKLLLQPVGKHFIIGALLTNCHTCLYGSVTTSYFDSQPPNLEDYLYF